MATPESQSKAVGSPLPIVDSRSFTKMLRIDSEQVRGILPELIDSITDAVAVIDSERRVVAANRRYIETFGTSGGAIAGEACNSSLHCPELQDDSSEGPCSACRAFDSREVVRKVRTVASEGAAPRRWEATFNPVVGSNGVVTHVVEVWRDISDRSQLEAQLSHSERLASLGSLAAGVAHEINNPLASVLASVESLQRWLTRTRGLEPEARAEAEAVLSTCELEIGRVRDTTDKLMLLARPITVRPDWVQFDQAVFDTLSLLRFHMRRQGIIEYTSLAGNLPPVWAKEGAVRSICMNLLMNAVQAMPDGGALEVSTRLENDHVVLEIADTGPGIAPQHLDRIWDPFFTTKPPGKGTGLGLSITRGQVERHGGAIRAERRPKGGSRFVVELPVNGPGG